MTTEALTPLQLEMLKRADAIFDSISKAVTTTANFAADQVPDIAYQYIAYGRVYLTSTVCFGVLLVVLAVLSVRKLITNYYDSNAEIVFPISMFVVMCVAIPGLMTIAVNINETFMVWFAPKIWLIKELVKLAKP